MTSAGDFKIVAIADLGGLGPKDGAPFIYKWTAPNRMPQLLPWLGLGFLLLLKRNRSAQTLWVAAPLVCCFLADFSARAMSFLPSDNVALLARLVTGVSFGLGALWLLSPYIANRNRFIGFLCMIGVLEGYSLFAFLVRQQISGDREVMTIMAGVAIITFAHAAALTLAGFANRRHFSAVWFSLWLFLGIVAAWTAGFVVISIFEGAGPLWQMGIALLGVSGITFGILLPFLILSFANKFYRARLKEMLWIESDVPPAAAPPVLLPSPESV